jgi:NDP-4-keto-2,6-dideoxyhexose 3-C-methyltransferase
MTDTNGGSVLVAVAHEKNKRFEEFWRLDSFLVMESYLTNLKTHLSFARDVENFKKKFVNKLREFKEDGKSVYGLCASTKFNVVLQHCGIDSNLISAIGEVNSYKYGRVTPGTNIPIMSEDEVFSKNPDVLVVGPYHFRDSFVKICSKFIDNGGKLMFPLPILEVVEK